MGRIVGIDLGTTNSCVAVIEGGRPRVAPNAEGERTTPSVVAYAAKSKDLLIGKMAKRQAVTNPENTFYSVKRFVGCTPAEVEDEFKKVAYGVKPDGNRLTIECPVMDKALAPEEVSAQVLRKLAADASAFLGDKVTQAVVTVPAYFNDSQRQATKNAGRIAGLEVLRIVNEPTAAALAYGLGKEKEQSILVFDLGGGTFDVSVLQIEEDSCEVLATNGDTNLGGDDFDKVIVDHLAETFKAQEGIDLRENSQTFQRLKQAAEEAKKELSSATQADVNLPFIATTQDGPKHLEATITRDRFNDLSSHLVDRCRGPVEKALADAGLSADKLDEVVMVGGSTRIPAVRDLARRLTAKEPNQTVNPDEAVALGAAIQGSLLSDDMDNCITLAGQDGESEGLAMLLQDVTPLSLGIEDNLGRMVKIIERNSPIPTKGETTFTTVKDNQSSVTFPVCQGEQTMAKDNKCLGTFELEGIREAPAGVPKIVVAMEIDANGILNVTARDKDTGREASISISGSSTLSEEEVNRMLKDAEDKVAG